MTVPACTIMRQTCAGMLIEVDMKPRADFPMAVAYDNTDNLSPRTCVLDLGHAGHWPLKGACSVGKRCVLSGPYFKRIGNTYYMQKWDKAETGPTIQDQIEADLAVFDAGC
jgi:hypothetical protein